MSPNEVRGDAIYVPGTPSEMELPGLMLGFCRVACQIRIRAMNLLDSLTGFGTTSQMYRRSLLAAPKNGELCAHNSWASPHLRKRPSAYFSGGVNGAFRRDICAHGRRFPFLTISGSPLGPAQAPRFKVSSWPLPCLE